MKEEGGAVEISVKPTQLGLDLDEERCAGRLLALAARAEATGNFVWIDMEQTRYVDASIGRVVAETEYVTSSRASSRWRAIVEGASPRTPSRYVR